MLLARHGEHRKVHLLIFKILQCLLPLTALSLKQDVLQLSDLGVNLVVVRLEVPGEGCKIK